MKRAPEPALCAATLRWVAADLAGRSKTLELQANDPGADSAAEAARLHTIAVAYSWRARHLRLLASRIKRTKGKKS